MCTTRQGQRGMILADQKPYPPSTCGFFWLPKQPETQDQVSTCSLFPHMQDAPPLSPHLANLQPCTNIKTPLYFPSFLSSCVLLAERQDTVLIVSTKRPCHSLLAKPSVLLSSLPFAPDRIPPEFFILLDLYTSQVS